MSVTLYKTTDDNRKLTKTLTGALTYNSVEIKDTTSMLNPYIIISTPSAESYAAIFNYNYAYVSDFSRYYFIKNIDIMSGKRVGLSLKCDVLMSHKSEIEYLYGTMTRNEEIGKPTMVADNKLPLYPRKEIKVIEFENSEFNIKTATAYTRNFVLNVAGGGIGNGS